MRATFLSALFMRVCQPGPEARKCASTSASSRSFTACLGLAMRGRPRRSLTSTPVAGRMTLPPIENSARLAMAAVSGRPSSGSVHEGFEDRDFLGIALPHRDDAPASGARRPDDIDQTTSQVAVRPVAHFSIVEPGVLNRHLGPGKDETRILEVEPTLGERPGPLARIVGDSHRIFVPPKKRAVKSQAAIGGRS